MFANEDGCVGPTRIWASLRFLLDLYWSLSLESIIYVSLIHNFQKKKKINIVYHANFKKSSNG